MTLLSIILPLGLLVSFRMSCIIPEPQTPETTTVEAVTWNMSRPTDIITINQRVRNSYSDNIVSVGLGVHVQEYYENMLDWPSDGDDDVVKLRVSTTLNISKGFIYSVLVRFSKDAQSYLCIDRHPASRMLQNLEGKITHNEYFKVVGVNQPRNASLSVLCWWALFDQDSMDHWLTVNLEVTYFNGASYQKVIMPIKLGVLVS